MKRLYNEYKISRFHLFNIITYYATDFLLICQLCLSNMQHIPTQIHKQCKSTSKYTIKTNTFNIITCLNSKTNTANIIKKTTNTTESEPRSKNKLTNKIIRFFSSTFQIETDCFIASNIAPHAARSDSWLCFENETVKRESRIMTNVVPNRLAVLSGVPGGRTLFNVTLSRCWCICMKKSFIIFLSFNYYKISYLAATGISVRI